MTLDELKRDFSHIDNLPIFRAGFELAGIASNGSRQAQFLDWYRSFVISPIGPSRPGLSFIEGQRPKHRRIIKTTGLYHRMFGKAFSAFVQDIYFLRSRLWFKVDQAAGGKLTRARHYTLHARWHKALPLYQELLSEATGTVREDTLFFYGTALLQARNPKSALKILDPLDAEFPSGKWRKISQFYRGEALSALGKNKEASEAYRSAPKDLLTPAPYRLNGLRMAANSR